MPGIALHLLCASRVLHRWRSEPDPPPFRLHDPRVVEAFLQGALAPDMGYFVPGGRGISDLAHRERPADLARALVREARGPLQTAFAWGWVTHVLADVALHPLINRATGELLDGGSGRMVTAAQRPAAHLRVELGLDAHVQGRSPGYVQPRLAPVLRGRGMRFLAAAFRSTHGSGARPKELARAEAAVRRLTPWMLLLNRAVFAVHGAMRGGPAGGAGGRPLPGQADSPEGGIALLGGMLTPVPPRPWLVREVRRVVRGFADDFLLHYRGGLRSLENRDLDTGALPATPSGLSSTPAPPRPWSDYATSRPRCSPVA